MNKTDNLYERIDAYLSGNLTESDRQAFEVNMQTDSSLKEEVELQKLVHVLILEKGLSDIRKQVGKDLSVPKSLPWGEITFIALSILLAGVLCYFWFEPFKKDIITPPDLPEVISKERLKQTSEVYDKKTTAPVQKGKDTLILQTPKHGNIIPDQQSVKQEQSTSQKQDAHIDVLQQVSSQNQNDVKEESKKIDKVPVPCPEILFNVHTEASCRNAHTGSVQLLLSDIQGGVSPYSYSIDGKSNSILTDLAAGTYTVSVKDKRGCFTETEVIVMEKNCTIFKDYSFNPDIESWKFPFTDMEHGTLSIMDKSGNIVYKTDLSNGLPYEWNGRSLNGNILETGSYLYIATFSNGEIRQGYIILLH